MSKRRLSTLRFRCPPPHPPVNFATLCRLLEIELALGQTRAFRLRLRRALKEALKYNSTPFE